VIHFAASKAVGESVENPLLYYENIMLLIYLLQELQQKTRSKFYFSSSCTVYGQAETMPITENASIQIAMSPYGNTKQIGKRLSQIRPKSLISTLFCCVISINWVTSIS
jgi:UDP-glucose 4-epimerase